MISEAILGVLTFGLPLASGGQPGPGHTASESGASELQRSFYDFTMKNIDGEDVALARYKRQVCLVVNVASR